MHQRLPVLGILDSGFGIRVVRKPAKQEALDGSAARNSVAHEPRGKYTGVVNDQQIAGAQVIRQLGKRGVLDCARLPRQHQQSRLPSFSRRTLSDQLVREIEVEIARSQGHGVRPFTVVHLREKKRSRFVRSFAASRGFQRSPTLAIRCRTLSILKSSSCTPFSSSFHVTGVDTVANGLGRTE